jgi:hypothetical protein
MIDTKILLALALLLGSLTMGPTTTSGGLPIPNISVSAQ